MDKRIWALLAALGAAVIYSINHTIAKDVMPGYIKPYGFIMLRVVGATILFWGIGLSTPKEKIAPSDRLRFLGCAFFGMALNMLAFFKGLSLTTPINSSVIMTTSPILVLSLSVLWLKEYVSLLKITGVGIGILGALLLTFYGTETSQNAANIIWGNSLIFVNATSYSIYLIMVKPLTAKYHPFTLLKWLFLIGIFINLPFTLNEFREIDWLNLPLHAILKFAFVIVGTTFLTYLLNTYALQQLKASTLSVFTYLQPFIASIFAVAVGSDTLSVIKIVAAVLVLTGVYLVTKRSRRF